MKHFFKGIIVGCILLFCCNHSFAQNRLQFRIEKILFVNKDSARPYKWVETDSLLNNKVMVIDEGGMDVIFPTMPYGFHDSLDIIRIDQGYTEEDNGAILAIFHYKDADGHIKKFSLYQTKDGDEKKLYYTGYDEDDKTIDQYLLTWMSGIPR
jgi:hypothetical protein